MPDGIEWTQVSDEDIEANVDNAVSSSLWQIYTATLGGPAEWGSYRSVSVCVALVLCARVCLCVRVRGALVCVCVK